MSAKYIRTKISTPNNFPSISLKSYFVGTVPSKHVYISNFSPTTRKDKPTNICGITIRIDCAGQEILKVNESFESLNIDTKASL